ncbi:N-acyl homoserine lactonase family protein [Puniceibacterium sp. IMCC21224]|uniref:N-acyl homoserine lactonase family protein n=1 Tax=Puniceibacterium sp. IMCC21224 TaxID=1618204 RepID=UPI00064D8361|nr:N-acyl homoserine lactonase family protein [Puniceibacterium sp. IMCC21224]KMK64844.1 Zn-dependent hydrolase, glyoxylase [Puniceibacterium sp. IMCC21224]
MNTTLAPGAIEPFELFAISYARHSQRTNKDNFIGGDFHESSDLAYYVWVARRGDRLFLIDTGFGPDAAAARGRELFQTPAQRLRGFGIDPAQIDDVILTHLHYDHAGTLADFPKATFHVQDSEAAYATGRCMCHGYLRQPFDVEDIVSYVRHLYGGRVAFHDGISQLADGLSLHRIGGHSAGLQVVRVWTRRGWVVIASDASHLYANLNDANPFPVVYDVASMLEGFRTVVRLADSEDHVIPGHDPMVMTLYPPVAADLEGQVFRLDVPPKV